MCTSWPFFATPGTSAGMGPLISAWITTVFPSVGISSNHFDSKVRNGIRKRAPNNVDATTDRHDAFAAVWGISSQCSIRAKTEHAIDGVGIVGSEELLGGRYVVFRVPFHLYAPSGSLLSGILCPSIQTIG